MDVVLPREALWTPAPAADALRDSISEAGRRVARWWVRRERANVLAAIGTPTSIGSLAQAASLNTITMTCSASVAAGQKVIVACGGAALAGVTVTFTDSGLNTWATDASNSATSTCIAIGSSQITNALTTSSTIKATYSSAISSRLIAAVQVSGLATAAIDKTSSASGTAVGWSSGATAATTQADELVVGACANDSTATETDTPGGSYTELFDFANTSAAELTMIYQIVAATGAQTGSGTWTNSGSRTWGAAVATYKGAASAAFVRPKIFVSREAHRRSTRW